MIKLAERKHHPAPVVLVEGQVWNYSDGLKALRRERGWSVKDLGEACGVSPRTVEGWEQGIMPSRAPMVALMWRLKLKKKETRT